jgi:archaellum component FlaC
MKELHDLEAWLLGKGYTTKAQTCADLSERYDKIKNQLRLAQEAMLIQAKTIQDLKSRVADLEANLVSDK